MKKWIGVWALLCAGGGSGFGTPPVPPDGLDGVDDQIEQRLGELR